MFNELPGERVASKTSFEKLSLSSEEEYVDFLIAAHKGPFNSKRFEDHAAIKKAWHWEYIDTPIQIDEKPLVWISRFEGRIIGQICIMPVELKAGDAIYKSGWCQDLIVLPEFRNTGIGYFLIRHAIEELTGILDMIMVAGMNEQSYTIFKNMGFIEIGLLKRNLYPLNLKHVSQKVTSNPIGRAIIELALSVRFKFARPYQQLIKQSGIEVSEARIDDTYDELWGDISRKIICTVKRDGRTMRWRFEDQPYRKYTILIAKKGGKPKGFILLRESRIDITRFIGLKAGIVSDIFFDPHDKEAGFTLLDAALRHFKESADLVRCDLLSDDIQGLVRAVGFIGSRSNSRFVVNFLTDKVRQEVEHLCQDRHNWHLTYGDSDFDLS